MGAKVVQLKPTPHEDYIIDPDDFPSDPGAAHCLGVLMAMSMPVVIRPLAYSSTSVTLTVYARRGWPAWRVASLTGLPEALVEAFNDGLNWRSAAPLTGFLPTNCAGADGFRLHS
jgi:hypothetical protein